MHIILVSDEPAFVEFRAAVPTSITLSRLSMAELNSIKDADLIFILDESFMHASIPKQVPVLLNSVLETRSKMALPSNVSRINGWPGFIDRDVWEIVAEDQKEFTNLLNPLQKKLKFVDDVAGMVSPRIVCMIINEAYFALGEGVSTKEEIDTAMKLGTNYPFGPFEWAMKIGLQNIADLLMELNKKDRRCKPAPALLYELSDQSLNRN